jgi:hypothetical protein
MKKLSKAVSLLASAAWLTPGMGLARDAVEVNFNAAVREYCHVVRFPSGWHLPGFSPNLSLRDDYEFRVPGVLGTRFLVRGVEQLVRKNYTTNLYEMDLSDPNGVAQPAGEENWNSATPITLWRGKRNDFTLPKPPPAAPLSWNRNPKYVEIHGLHFIRSGDEWAGAVLSQDQAVLIMQSWSGTLGPSGGSDVPGDFSISLKFGNSHGKLFFDVYNADSGKKLITFTASFYGILPEEEVFGKTGWVTEQYFIIPLDERRERCLVCEFGRKR